MKILHTCLAAFYIDGFSYQENVLPKIHKQMGLSVEILASTENYDSNVKLCYVEPGSYINSDGIKVTRVPYVNWLPFFLVKKLRIYKGVTNILETFKPDIIYLHDMQFLGVAAIVRYVKRNKVKVIVDTHTDFINSGKNWISKHILHSIIYRYCAQLVLPYADKFYGTIPARIDFLRDVYGIPESKIELLPFGVDDTAFDWAEKEKIRKFTRAELGLDENNILLISGGKMDKRKNFPELIRAYKILREELKIGSIRLLIFGKPNEEMRNEILGLVTDNPEIIYLDWLPSSKIHKYLMAADLAIFPGTHSVLWEEVVGLGIPALFKKWERMNHIDLGGNCLFLESGDRYEISSLVKNLVDDTSKFEVLKDRAVVLGPVKFRYTKIAQQVLNFN
jgi:glycosyltransferase involved in cell wall biosynthesis